MAEKAKGDFYMRQKALIIINPMSGMKRANKHLTDIVDIFTKAGYVCTVMTTLQRGDGTVYAREWADKVNLIVAVGGDGTFNEVVAGVMESGERVRIGYIPSGSTNDFASSLNLSKDIVKAARDIAEGSPVSFDIGSFNGRKFSYVASFGAFTEASYGTPQNVKNALGHLAYILEGIKSISSIKKSHMVIEADGKVYEGDYIFGAISNATSVGGILTLNPEYVDMRDGKFELLLVKAPKDLIDLTEIVYMLSSQDYNSNILTFINAEKFQITADADTPWSLDGEYQEGCEKIEIVNHHHAIELMMAAEEMN